MRLSVAQRIRAWRLGFTARNYVLYDLDHNDPDAYVHSFMSLEMERTDPNLGVINHKSGFSEVLAALDAPHPRVLGIFHGGRVHVPGSTAAPSGDIAAWLESDALPRAGVVFKPVDGHGGAGVFFLKFLKAGLELNGRSISAVDCCRLLAGLDHCYASDFIEQAAYARALFPGTTNTVRVLSLWDYENGEPYIAAAAQRMGKAGGSLVDNFHQGLGGYCANIDVDTGELSAAVTLHRDGRLEHFDRHPDTDAPIKGVRVPGWDDVLHGVLRTCRALPQYPFVGWDLAITDTGFSILEANSPPAVMVWQAHLPLLADPRRRRSFAELGMAVQPKFGSSKI